MASAADGYGGAADDQLFHPSHHHHQQQHVIYHVPQHSRREKLRFPPDVVDSSLLLHPSSSYYSSSHHQHHQLQPNPNNYALVGPSTSSHYIPTAHPLHHLHPGAQIPFSLSLSSAGPPAPLGPFTGYAAVLSRSRFLTPARQLLDDICSAGGAGPPARASPDNDPHDLLSADPYQPATDHRGPPPPGPISCGDEQHWKKTRLISMLDEVYRRYKQYYQQVQAVIASFEAVAGLSTAAPYATMALKAMAKHFRCVKNAISDQLRHINKALGKEDFSTEENAGFGHINNGMASHRAANNLVTFKQPPVWRPQRGLPERAVAVLRAWLFEHFLHPYPSDTDKQMLAKQTGLSRNQVSNWFINARVRLWKPMVEEIHSLEMRQSHKLGATTDRNYNSTDKQVLELPSPPTATSSNNPPSQINISPRNQNPTSKRPHDELTQLPNPIDGPFNFVTFDDLSSSHHVGVGGGIDQVGGNGGVSLTLGLHQNQNNGVYLAEPIPLNVVRRFGLEECNDAYAIGAFGGQGRHFDKDIGGHFLHDFVG